MSNQRSLTLGLRAFFAVLFLGAPLIGGFVTVLQVVRNSDPGVQGLDGAKHIAAGATDGTVFVTSSEDEALVVLGRDASTDALVFRQALFDGVDGVFGLGRPSSVSTTRDGSKAFVTSSIDDSLALFVRDASTDHFALADIAQQGVGGVSGLDGSQVSAVHPTLPVVYAGGTVSSAVAVFTYDASSDQLAFVESQENGQNGVFGLGDLAGIALSPDGKHLYAAGPDDDAIARFAVSLATGRLTYLGSSAPGTGGAVLRDVSSLLVTGDGRHLYATESRSRWVVGFERNPATGDLTYVTGFRLSSGDAQHPKPLVSSPDGRLVAIIVGDDRLQVFRRDLASGALEFLREISEGQGGVNDVSGLNGISVTADGNHALTAASIDNAVTMFSFGLIFGDGFESASTSAWSEATP